jgi:hypothetical protein
MRKTQKNQLLEQLWTLVVRECTYQVGREKPSRRNREVMVRHLFFAVSDHFAMGELQNLATFVGLKDHTTVLHGIRRVKKACSINPLGRYAEPVVANRFNNIVREFAFDNPQYLVATGEFEQTEIEKNTYWLIAP